ncbi:MAG: biotin/lipoyl-binding protein [Actinomycetales bacterium]|nr:biotin/lipoyl-binding protein [Actinomycetales bacterium]
MFTRVLIANRGEIACRIKRTLDSLGIASVLVHSGRDRALAYVREHPAAVELPDTDRTGGYLDVDAVIRVATSTGCDALHPGYGFLSENPELARACAGAGIAFIGPSAQSMAALGDKAQARAIAVRAGVPVVPGVEDEQQARQLALPVLIKPVAGGGGKGMHVVTDAAQFDELVARARREAASSFGDDRLIFEKYLPRARHIEVQVVGLPGGEVVAVGDRECSLQRRHQKVIEEAPAPNLPDAVRASIHAAAEAVVREVGYLNAGTVEFVVSCDDPAEFYFLEVNTRLQVEHPVTEEVTGLDLVAVQLQVAHAAAHGGSSDSLTGILKACRDNGPCGHAVEARVYAEDPARGFLPSAGPLLLAAWPRGIRVDAGVRTADTISAGYDPMIAKVISCAADRPSALAALGDGLAESAVLGVSNNIAFLRTLLADERVRAGAVDTRLIDRDLDFLTAETAAPWWLDAVASAVWAQHHATPAARRGTPPTGDAGAARTTRDPAWSRGWRPGGIHAAVTWRAECGEREVLGQVGRDPGDPARWLVVLGEQRVSVRIATLPDESTVAFDAAASTTTEVGRLRYALHRSADADEWWFAREGATWAYVCGRAQSPAHSAGSAPEVRSPMPGTVTAVPVARGERVRAGQPLVVLEAMKMEHQVSAPHDGTVTEVSCAVGSHVRLREVLAVVAPE